MNMNNSFSINRRFWISFILCIPIFIITTGDDFFKLSQFLSRNSTNIIQLLISIPIVFWCGSFFYTEAWNSIIKRKLNMFVLVAIAVINAWLFSFYSMLYPEQLPASFHLADGSIPVFFASACYVTMFILFGHMLEMNAEMKISEEIRLTLKHSLSSTELEQAKNTIINAKTNKMPLENTINKISQYFVIIVLIIAVAAFVLWDSFGPTPASLYALLTMISILLAACPCALTLAAPISISITLNKAAKKGILINNPAIFEDIYKTQDIKEVKKNDIVLTNKKIDLKKELIDLTNKMTINIKENLALGIIYNIIMIPIAAGILYPHYHQLVSPVAASVAMSLSSLIVITNAIRLKKQ